MGVPAHPTLSLRDASLERGSNLFKHLVARMPNEKLKHLGISATKLPHNFKDPLKFNILAEETFLNV
jgi:hypothetical protein